MTTLPLHCTVLKGAPQAVWLPDGSTVDLHRVCTSSTRARMLRALRRPSGWMVIDLARIAPSLRADLPGALERDVDALVLRALRQACATSKALLAAAAMAADPALSKLATAAAGLHSEAAQ